MADFLEFFLLSALNLLKEQVSVSRLIKVAKTNKSAKDLHCINQLDYNIHSTLRVNFTTFLKLKCF